MCYNIFMKKLLLTIFLILFPIIFLYSCGGPSLHAMNAYKDCSHRYENIVDDHVMFELAEEKRFYPDGKKRLGLTRFIKKKKINDTIEEKILDIETIRKLD